MPIYESDAWKVARVVGLCNNSISRSEMIKRDMPGYAIGGLSVGETREEFWPFVKLCCDHLPLNKPRYLMGVGFESVIPRFLVIICRYAVDLVICSAFGVDMFDCVYPTRTAVWISRVRRFDF